MENYNVTSSGIVLILLGLILICLGVYLVSRSKFVTPEEYGAVGDGVADDSGPIQAALSSNKPVHLKGTYRITRTIRIPPNSTIKGAGGLRQIIITDGCPINYEEKDQPETLPAQQ